MIVIVSDTSPITNLAAVSQLDLLQQLYQRIVVPQAVYDEMVGLDRTVPGTAEVQSLEWIEVRQVRDRALVTQLREELDAGESEAIALAIELQAERLIIDEADGRAVAARFGLQFTGVLGILLAAKSQGFLTAVKPVMDGMIAQASFRVSSQVYAEVLRIAGE